MTRTPSRPAPPPKPPPWPPTWLKNTLVIAFLLLLAFNVGYDATHRDYEGVSISLLLGSALGVVIGVDKLKGGNG